jgi:hypothetical protein
LATRRRELAPLRKYRRAHDRAERYKKTILKGPEHARYAAERYLKRDVGICAATHPALPPESQARYREWLEDTCFFVTQPELRSLVS